MTNFKRIMVSIKHYDYAEVAEIFYGQVTYHKLGIRNTTKRNLPFVLLKQTLPPYTKIRVRLDKLGLSEDKESGVYDFYFEE